jgi:hypothetical protein
MRFLRGPQSGAVSKRLQLAHMVDHIDYSVTGSDFESSLCLYQASLRAFGGRAQRRMRLRPPAFLRMSLDNKYPRVYATAKSFAHPVALEPVPLGGPAAQPAKDLLESRLEEVSRLFRETVFKTHE